MRTTRTDIMGMPITIDLQGEGSEASLEAAFAFLEHVDEQFSTYKPTSEISRINAGELSVENSSDSTREVFAIAEQTRRQTNGFFDVKRPDGTLDPSGVVKGWAVKKAAELLTERGHSNFMVEAAGDIALSGTSPDGTPWSIGIRNPFEWSQIVKIVQPRGRGIATSGSAARGAHIYNPHSPSAILDELVSVTVIAADVLEADRFATAAFAMQRQGIHFLEQTEGLEGYAIDKSGIAVMTSGFSAYTT